jgi:quercetin dioxygenase-like cupin family protein
MKFNKFKDLKFKDRKFFNKVVYKKCIVFNEDDLISKGSKFQIVTFKPESRVKPHYHKKTTEIFYIKEGKGTLKLNGREYNFKKDDIFLCEPKDTHEFVNNTNKDFTVLIFKTNEEKDDIFWD